MSEVIFEINDFDLGLPRLGSCSQKQSINLLLEKGNVLWLQGPNGCGKTTLLKKIWASLQSKDPSDFIFDSSLRASFMPQSLNKEFFIPMSLGEVSKLSGVSQSVSSCRGLFPKSLESRGWNSASGGEKQKAIITQTLSVKKPFYILDEPFNHLDSEGIEECSKIIFQRMYEGSAFLIASHLVPDCFVDSELSKLVTMKL